MDWGEKDTIFNWEYGPNVGYKMSQKKSLVELEDGRNKEIGIQYVKKYTGVTIIRTACQEVRAK